jgi:protein TonB
MVVMGSVVVMICVGGAVMGYGKGVRVRTIEDGGEVFLKPLPDVPTPPLPPPPKVLQPQVATLKMTTVQIVPDKDVKPDEKPPENDAANDVHIGTQTKAGDLAGDIVGPPSNGTIAGVVEKPKKAEDDGPVLIVEIDASFPGGLPAWARFMNKNLRYPEEAMNQGLGGTVVVQFVVDLDGNVSDVKAVSGPETGGMREEAERVIRKSGKWVPAVQNGRHVKAYRRQPVTFQPAAEN